MFDSFNSSVKTGNQFSGLLKLRLFTEFKLTILIPGDAGLRATASTMAPDVSLLFHAVPSPGVAEVGINYNHMNIDIAAEDHMHGSMFILLRRFVENVYDFSTWIKLVEAAGIQHGHYQMQEVYPTKEMLAIIHRASELTGDTVYELMERYGEFLVSDLLLVYNKYINPAWHTYDLLLNTEAAMHAAVKREDNKTNPPMLLVTKKGPKQLIVDYNSKRKMAGIAVGIIKGIANYFHERDIVEVTLLTPADKERVQIRVDFVGNNPG